MPALEVLCGRRWPVWGSVLPENNFLGKTVTIISAQRLLGVRMEGWCSDTSVPMIQGSGSEKPKRPENWKHLGCYVSSVQCDGDVDGNSEEAGVLAAG